MELNNAFTISAKTCTLKYNNQEGRATILDNGNKFVCTYPFISMIQKYS